MFELTVAAFSPYRLPPIYLQQLYHISDLHYDHMIIEPEMASCHTLAASQKLSSRHHLHLPSHGDGDSGVAPLCP
jgi:hypothetical protein